MKDEVTRARETYSRFGFSYLGMYFVTAILLFAAMFVGKQINHGEAVSRATQDLINMAIRFVIAYPLMLLLVKSIPTFDIPKKKLGVGRFIACMIISYTVMYISSVVGTAINGAIGKLTGLGPVNPISDFLQGMSLPMQLIIVVILAPVFEELLFRKFLIDRVVNYGELPAMLMSGLMFGLFHENLAQFVYATALGMFFAYIYIRTGRIIYTILFHFFVNGFSTFMTNGVYSGVDLDEMQGYLSSGDMEGYMQFVQENSGALVLAGLVGILVFIIIIAGIILMIVNRKKVTFESHPEEIAKGLRFKTFIMNPGMLLYTLYFVIMIVLIQFGFDWFQRLVETIGLVS